MSYDSVAPDMVYATQWLTFLYIPLIPLQRWLSRYAGRRSDLTSVLHELESPVLMKLEKVPLGLSNVLGTYAWAMVTCCALFGPIGFMIWWTNQRAARPLEIGFLFGWTVLVATFPFWNTVRERALLEESLGREYAEACQFQRKQQSEQNRVNWQRAHFFPMWVYIIPALGAFLAAEWLANMAGWNNKDVKAVVWVGLIIVMGGPVYWLDRYVKKQQNKQEKQGTELD